MMKMPAEDKLEIKIELENIRDKDAVSSFTACAICTAQK